MCHRRKPFLTIAFRLFSRQLLLIIFVGCAIWAQDASTGALRGMVFDAQGAAITNADIVVISVETGVRYHTATDSAGRFAVDLLPPGQYAVRAEAEAMSPEISPMLRVEIGEAALLTFKLKVAGPQETITVSDAPRMAEMDPSALSALVDE
jgi:hypothetical protein